MGASRNRSGRACWRVLPVALVSVPGAVFGAEGGQPGGVFAGDLGNALWTLVIFGLVVFVLGRFAWKPLLGALSERERFIRAALEQAKRDREEAAETLRKYQEQLTQARSEATAIVEEGRRDAESVKRRILEEAQEESRQVLERSRREIEIASETAKKELYTLSARLATDLAGKILAREIRLEDHRKLLDQALSDLESRVQ